MKLFLDTSNKYFIVSLISEKDEVIDFYKIESNKTMVKNSNFWFENFIKKNNINFQEITSIYLTNGPGSYTGMKVSLNIIKTFNLFFSFKNIYCINTIELQKQPNKLSIIQTGKKKFVYRKKILFFTFFKTIDDISNIKEKNLNLDDFDENVLIQKIKNKRFKKISNLDKIKLRY